MNERNESAAKSELDRDEMVYNQIEARGIRDPRVLAAIRAVPREQFVPPNQQMLAYDDRALSIEHEQTISQPYIVAYMTRALCVGPHDRVLEVGTGSGYQTAVLAHLTDRLDTIERLEALSAAAADRLERLGIGGVRFHIGDGSLGWASDGPYDRIIVTAAAPHVPQPLLDQLVDGGLIIVPVGDTSQQTLVSVVQRGGRSVERSLIACRFVKLIGRSAWEES